MKKWEEVLLTTALVRFFLFDLSIFLNFHSTNSFIQNWVRWDGPHYIDIAQNWYQPTGEISLFIVFYPLYPILIKLFNLIFTNYYLAAVLVSLFFSFIAAILLYELVLLDFNKKIAFRAVWFLNIFPTSYFLQASYTESLFLATSLASIYFLRKGLPEISGLTGMLATMTRANGILLLPLILMEIKSFKKNITALLFMPIGLVFYLLINFSIYKDFFYFTKPLWVNWYKKFEWPWIGINNLTSSIPSPHSNLFYAYFAELVSIIFVMGATIYVYLKIRRSYGLYMLLNTIMITSTSFIMSTPRYILILFPIFIALAQIKSKIVLVVLSIISIILLLFFTSLYTKGAWAF